MDKSTNQLINHKRNELQTQSTSLQISNPKITKCIGENIYLLGYNGAPEQLILMANKLVDLFGQIEVEDLQNIFDAYHTGERKFKYGFNITNLTIALQEMDYRTIQQQKNEKSQEEFFSFQNQNKQT